VPIDDENTLSIGWFFTRVPKENQPYVQGRIPTWRGPVTDSRGRFIDSHVMNQDFIAWVGQGRIADRTRENLGLSDRGIVMMRRQYAADLEAVAAGRDPKGIIRDEAAARCVVLPNANRSTYVDGLTRAEMADHPLYSKRFKGFLWQAGQPDAVWNAYAAAMGLGADSRDPGEILRI
jgi:5,5'-dehydrodivanillate O-demethylase